MKMYINVTILLFFIANSYCAQNWAELSSVEFSDVQRSLMQSREFVVIKKDLKIPATQVLFSWNVVRPGRGKYLFSMQVYDETVRRWSNWSKVAEWGKDAQRSFEGNYSNEPSFFYVRWQVPEGRFVRQCRVKIESIGGATLDNLYRLSFAAINYPLFLSEIPYAKRISYPSIQIKQVPPISQMEVQHTEAHRICSPTSLSMVVSYLNRQYEAPEVFAEGAYDRGLEAYGSWPFNVAHAFDRCKCRYFFSVTRLNSFAEIYEHVRQRLPLVISVRGAMHTMPEGKTYKDGHLLVVVGWDNDRKEVLCYDPAFSSSKQVAHAYLIGDFLKAWERSGRLAYVIEKRA